ncbi:MAG: FGGY family carbohydrate kinase, partial [Bacteroidota bacterium]
MLLGLDIGSSSVKAVILDPSTGKTIASATAPEQEMTIHAPHPGWAEQDPESWWKHVLEVIAKMRRDSPEAVAGAKAIGISYQMHGLVCVDRNGKPLR